MINQADELPEWTDDERKLLASAALDRPPVASLPRALQAATAAALATTAAASSAAALGTASKAGTLFGLAKPLGIVKWLAVLTLAGGAAVGVAAWRSRPLATPVHPAAITNLAPTSVAEQPATPPPPEPAATQAPTAEASSSPPLRGAPNRGSARSEPSAASQPDLTRDIAALDEARRALRAGHAQEALAALDRYESDNGRSGALRTEAQVLRIEATARSGDRARAEALARAFLKRNPKSPYAARVRAQLPP